MTAETIERQNVFDTNAVEDVEESTDLSKKAHIISPSLNTQLFALMAGAMGRYPTAQEMVNWAVCEQLELVAICQYRWVPTGRAGAQDACEACMVVAQNWISEDEG